MIEVGRLCVKIAGREAGKKCVIVDVLDKNYVIIDGDVRRKKCNMEHLEPLDQILKLKKNASSSDVESEFKKLGLAVRKTKPKKTAERPKQVRAKERKQQAEKEGKPAKKEMKKEKKKAVKEAKPEASIEESIESELGKQERAEKMS